MLAFGLKALDQSLSSWQRLGGFRTGALGSLVTSVFQHALNNQLRTGTDKGNLTV